MKKKLSNESLKTIIIVGMIIIVCLLMGLYKINFPILFSKTNDFLSNENQLSRKEEVTLDKCIDGDTAKLELNNKKVKVRFLAIDTPETVHPNMQVEKLGEEASQYTCKLLKYANKITIAYEKGLTNKDKYGRDLVWLWVDDKLIQELLIRKGYAKVRYIYAKYKYTNKLINIQKDIKKKKVGLWTKYVEIPYDNEIYAVIFKVNGFSQTVDVKNGDLVEIINNPTKRGYTFSGWTVKGQLVDLSIPITDTVILEPKFDK